MQLEDKNNGQLFAEAPITEFPTKSIEPVSDSSRYFVLKIENQGRTAFIGVGFADRSDSFDFNVALQVFYLAYCNGFHFFVSRIISNG